VVVRVVTECQKAKGERRTRGSSKRNLYSIPDGKGENDCRMLAKGGKEEESRRSVRSMEGRIQICGLKDDGRIGAILS